MAAQSTTEGGAGVLPRPARARGWLPLPRAIRGAGSLSNTLADVLACFIAIKIGFYLLALFATWMLPEYAGGAYGLWHTGADRMIDISWRWDGQWYMSIAREGYRLGDGYANVAFFPLFPLLVRLLGLALGEAQLPLAGVLVVNFAFLGALFYLYMLAAMDGGPGLARRAIWYVAIMPTAFFFHVAYAESLFLLAAAGVIYHARRGQWWLAGLWGLLGAATRAQGLLLWLPLAWELARHWRREKTLPRRHLPALLLPPLGIGVFMAYLLLRFGDPLAFLHVQSEWGRSFGFPPATLWRGLEAVFAGYQSWKYPLQTINTAMVSIYLAVALASVRRGPASYTLYVVASLTMALLLPVEQSPTESAARFMAVLFPVAFSVAAWSEAYPPLGRLVSAASLPLFALLASLFVTWHWVV